MSVPNAFPPVFCEQCAQGGQNTLADYVYQPEEITLTGPMMGNPDAWPPDVHGLGRLCQEHYSRLPADSRIDYIPAEGRSEASGERDRTA